MTRVIKKKAHIILTAILTIMIMLTAIPIQNTVQNRVEAAGFTLSSGRMYFDITDIPNKNEWTNSVYLYIDGWGTFNKMDICEGTDIYYINLSDWNMNGAGWYMFTNKTDWNNVNAGDKRRTTVGPGSLSDVFNGGKYCYWDGTYTVINGKNVYSLAISDTAIDHLSPVPAGGTKRIYFDATLSKLSYRSDANGANEKNYVLNEGKSSNIPYDNGKVYYYITNANGTSRWSGEMTKEANSDLWYIDIDPAQHKRIRFTAWANPSDESAAQNGDGTAMMNIPANENENTFFADTGDTVVYYIKNGENISRNRGGYWGKKGNVRDAGAAKNSTVVNIPDASMTKSNDVLYLNSTFYDYYSDYELNGSNRADYPVNVNESNSSNAKFASHRNWVPFRQLSQAMSSYYTTENVPASNTIYTGHYQPDVNDNGNVWGYPFSQLKDGLSLSGTDSSNYNKFIVNNNSVKSLDNAGIKFYRYATQGILASSLNDDGDPVMNGTDDVVLPHFNKEFLEGENSKNTKLGEVYENVAFPFTKVDRDDNGIYYWSFDSAATTLRLSRNTNNETNTQYPYFLNKIAMATIEDSQGRSTEASRAGDKTITDRTATENRTGNVWSKNLISAGVTKYVDDLTKDYPSNKYGFFPLNDTSINESNKAGAAKYNYGFGTKLEFDFTLSNNGNITTYNGQNQQVTAATTFNFSGDDDVWVFIDGKLVLDIGGDHGRASGCINFSKDRSYDYSYSYKKDEISDSDYANHTDVNVVTNRVNAASVLVSEVKKSTYHNGVYSNVGATTNATQESLWTKLGITTEAKKDEFYKSTHTLTFFYMERGMWESNMRLQFNFPDDDSIEIGKTIDTSNVNDDLVKFFENVEIMFEIDNLVTHYGAQATTVESGYNISQGDIRDYGSASGTTLKPAVGAYYTMSGEDERQTTNNNGLFSLKNGESALFSNQFRRGSYLGISEVLGTIESDLYTTTWTMYENGEPVTSYGASTKVTGAIPSSPLSSTASATHDNITIDDNRVEQKDEYSGGNYNAYTTAAKPNGGAIVFRSYSRPDDSVNIKLKAAFINKVNTGKLIVKKLAANNDDVLNGTYTFTVTLSNIGGDALHYEEDGVPINTRTYTFTLDPGEQHTISGVPVGTEYTIVETVDDDSTLADVTGADSADYVNKTTRTVKGTISYDADSTTKGETDEITFKNTKKELMDIEIIKRWDRLLGTSVPANVYLCLQYTTTPNEEASWTAVDGYSKLELTATKTGVEIGTVSVNTPGGWVEDTVDWKYTISGLEKADANNNAYYYRLREYDSTGNTLLAPLGKYSTKFTVSYDVVNYISADSTVHSLNVRNTYTYINMPGTGVSPVINFTVIGVSALALAVIALLIYKKRLQKAAVKNDERRGQ